MRTTALWLAGLLGVLLTFGCGNDEAADPQDDPAPVSATPVPAENAAGGTPAEGDLPSAGASDGSLSLNPNAR